MAEVLVPRIAVGVEVQQTQRSVFFSHYTEQWQRDAMIPSETYGDSAGFDDRTKRFLNAFIGIIDESGNDRQIPIVDSTQMIEDVHVSLRVARLQKHRCAPDSLWAETGAHAEGCPGIEQHPKHGEIRVGEILVRRKAHKSPDSTKPR